MPAFNDQPSLQLVFHIKGQRSQVRYPFKGEEKRLDKYQLIERMVRRLAPKMPDAYSIVAMERSASGKWSIIQRIKQ